MKRELDNTYPAKADPSLRSESRANWICTNKHCIPLAPLTAKTINHIGNTVKQVLKNKLKQETWIRYELSLTESHASLVRQNIFPITDAVISQLQEHPWQERPQLLAALRYWKHGLRNAYIWKEDEKPLCFQWLFTHRDNPRLRDLPRWAGMYPPLKAHEGQVENLIVLPAGLRYPGRVSILFAHTIFSIAYEYGIRRLITHIHEDNVAAQRWAHRTGWTSYGTIQRYELDVKSLRSRPLYLHL